MTVHHAAIRLGSRHWRGRPASEAQISAFEGGICGGVVVPDDYRAFLKTHNGGSPIPITTPSSGDGDFGSFFELDAEDTASDLRAACIDYFTRLPPTISPIGFDAAGRLLCLSIIGPNRGRVYLRDLVDRNAPLIEIAPSFTALLRLTDDSGN